ncbi:MarR family transcriptional regulator [Kineosporia sp. J2-2]|uniref:MarR family transcriptional regulator n=1 Tax=Kineosporia corallincola TaxID=2835133 RepID=A0ABS5TKL9_9ACTN|nr:MarR family transcriptional regulator [Kineosporia corallincola]MBT0771565.1 MarR family transcriptional regulator [Kineosporia corallincola]
MRTAPENELGEHLVPVLGRLARLLRQIELPGEPSPVTLAVLRRLRDEGTARITDLARAERASQPAMTQLLGRMERAGLVVRVHDQHDRRSVRAQITGTGRDLLRRTENHYARALGLRLGQLSAHDRDTLGEALPALAHLASAPDLPPMDLTPTFLPAPKSRGGER